jgi:MraZ protein
MHKWWQVVDSGGGWGECGSSFHNGYRKCRGEIHFQRKRFLFMFMGEYSHSIDAKGRLIIPAKFRELLGEEFVLTKGLDGCLSIYPMDEWNAFEEKLRALPLTNKNARTFTRFFVAGATVCELDKQGRILVPATLREFAGLEKDVVLTGSINRIEIWSKSKWIENSNYDDMDSIAEGMQDMGIVI